MRKKENEVRKKMIVIRINETEFEKVENLRKKSTAKNLSEYARNLLIRKPVFIKFRNESADTFLTEMIDLKKQLNGIGNNFNQAVHKLHLLDRIPEFRNWITEYEDLQKIILAKIDAIKIRMNQLHEELTSFQKPSPDSAD